MKEREPIGTGVPKNRDELFGLDKQESLQSTNFATTENTYLNESFQDETDE
ncbi:hypothetical protein [Bacillus sp. SG-1]|uniref:hypothetical protein n=1 Tax=Bacillus sp. SG-1 TaxID=161544 RepID=UPI0001543517|nr:hypothetical protein [Bacillus sp. SG-1]EDL65647.1 hypothetical protein BSG1_12271 [Bacillus sp. SG-1]